MSWARLPTVAVFLLLVDTAVARAQTPQPADSPEETITVSPDGAKYESLKT